MELFARSPGLEENMLMHPGVEDNNAELAEAMTDALHLREEAERKNTNVAIITVDLLR